jgi:basic membrane protein A
VKRGLTRRALIAQLAGVAAWSAGAHGALGAEPPLVAFIHTQAAGDNGVVDGMIASVNRIGRDFPVTVRTIFANDPANYQPILELLGEAKAAVVITTFQEMTQPLRAVAPEFPATRFLQLYGDPFVPSIRNVRTVAYETHPAGYLSGVCGAFLSKSGRLGYIGGTSIPLLNANVNAMIAGARSVNPTVDTRIAFVGSFQDPTKALDIANQMFGGAIDYVQAEAAASDQGTIDSANAHTGRIVIGGSRPAFALGPQTVAAITLCDFGTSLYQQTSAALKADWRGGHYRSGLADGVVDFTPSPIFLAHGPPAEVAKFRAAWPAITEAKRRIASGTISVPFKTALG